MQHLYFISSWLNQMLGPSPTETAFTDGEEDVACLIAMTWHANEIKWTY